MQDELFIPGEQVWREAAEAEECFPGMKEAEFRAFYEKTAHSLWSYLRRAVGNASLADDLLQETYLRFLGAAAPPAEDAHRKNYLFRIATNLMRDHFRAARHPHVPLPELSTGERTGRDIEVKTDMSRILLELPAREREMLWLAYVEGYKHEEIAGLVQCKTPSVRPMLFRARQRLAGILRTRGWKHEQRGEEKS